jgi:major membrane immunogen (membrane-anchored lipoprotein)
MRNFALLLILSSGTMAVASVSVSSPTNGSTVSTTVQYVASASSSCSKGVSAMGIYTAPGLLAYSTAGAALNTSLTLNPGVYNTVVEEWDNCGGASTTPITITVGSGGSGGSGQVTVTSPKTNSTVTSTVQYVASASSSCSKGVSAMGIYTAPGVLAYSTAGAELNTTLTLNPGVYHTTVEEWDNCGGAATAPVTITVGSGGSGSGAQVTVTAPKPNSTVSSPVQYTASASSSCSKGVSAMGIYTASGLLAYSAPGAELNTTLTLNPGTYNTVVEEWDNCGGAATTPVTITVGSGGGGSNSGTFTNLHQESGWNGYALLPPLYNICTSCVPAGPQATWSMTQKISSPSLSGNSSKMDIGGDTDYSDILWNNHLIGNFSTQGMPDTDHTIIPSLYNFTYDVHFYVDDPSISQALEFDINEFVGGYSYIWGHECRIAGGNEWDVWDDQAGAWHPTGVACYPLANAWNHLVLQVQRTSDNQLLFQSITLNGVTSTLNYYGSPTPTTWYGVTINYQQDGNYKQTPYSVWLDELNFTYW